MDKFSAVWLSHSSINSFKNCPRAYYLQSIYRDPRNHHKISLLTPALALGSAVHEVLESLSVLPVADRFKISLLERFRPVWAKISRQGLWDSESTEKHYRERGEAMLRRVLEHPGPLAKKAVKIKLELPYYPFSEADNLILCGKIDWLEYLPTSTASDQAGAVHIIDFKTGVGEESVDSLQLPIYYLLAHNCQQHPVQAASYWYLERDDLPTPKTLPDLKTSESLVLKIGKEIKLARSLNRFKCPGGLSGCRHCDPYEKILRSEAQFIGVGDWNTDLYVLPHQSLTDLPQSEIL